MKIIFFSILTLLSLNVNANVLLICRDVDSSFRLEMRTLPKVDSMGNTVENVIQRQNNSDVYFRAYPLSIGDSLVYKSSVEPGFDGPDKDDGPIESFRLNIAEGASVGARKQLEANLIVRQYEYEKKYFCDGKENPVIPRDANDEFVIKHKCKRWDMVRMPLKALMTKVFCEVAGPIEYKNACVGKTSSEVQSLLFSSSQNHNPDLAEQAIGCGADVNAADNSGCTPLMMAVADGQLTCASQTPAPVDSLAQTKARYLFNSLAGEGAFLDTQENITRQGAIHKAVLGSNDGVIRDIIGLEGDLNLQDRNGTTALMLAAQSGYRSAINALVVGGASLGLKDNQGRTAYDLGSNLPEDVRETLLEPKVTLAIMGEAGGGCTPLALEVPVGQYVKFNFTAAAGKMFILNIPAVNVSLMADGGTTASKTTRFDKPGTYAFQCGVHGGVQNTGQIIAK